MRAMPMYFAAVYYFSCHAPYLSATAWSSSASSGKFSCVLRGELRLLAVSSTLDTEHRGLDPREVRQRVAKVARLGRAPRRVVLRIEVEHQRPASVVRQAVRLAFLILQRKRAALSFLRRSAASNVLQHVLCTRSPSTALALGTRVALSAHYDPPSRRHFLQVRGRARAGAPFRWRHALAAEPPAQVPGVLGLEMYTLRHLFDKDLTGHVADGHGLGLRGRRGRQLCMGESAAGFKTLIGQLRPAHAERADGV